MTIRMANEGDRAGLRKLHLAAFADEGEEIVGLVEDLLEDATAQPAVSLLAELDGTVVGHVLFTKAEVRGPDDSLQAQILAPLAVLPDAQGRGIGRRLVEEGLEMLRASGVELVFVLGHPGYYPRFGFQPAGERGFEAPYEIPEEHAEAWMVLELQAGVIERARGTVRCAAAMDQERYWRE